MQEEPSPPNTIILLEHKAYQASFSRLYKHTMALIEEAARYTDRHAQKTIHSLDAQLSGLYAKESLLLTTRLMHAASWLLLLRAGQEQEMSPKQIAVERKKISLNTPSLKQSTTDWDNLPEDFRRLVTHSLRLEKHLKQLEESLSPKESHNPVGEQLKRISALVRNF